MTNEQMHCEHVWRPNVAHCLKCRLPARRLKQRPLVDSHVKALAERFMEDYRAHPVQGDPRVVVEDATWDLAGVIQHVIEDWFNDAVETRRLEERS